MSTTSTSTSTTAEVRGPMLYNTGANMMEFSEGKECKQPKCVELWQCNCAYDAARKAEAAAEAAAKAVISVVYGNADPAAS